MAGIDRNAPCPCGSGTKYKRCCLAREEEAAAPKRAWVHDADEELLEAILRFAERELGFRSGWELLKDAPAGLDIESSKLFWFDWMVFHSPFPERSIAQQYLHSGGRVVHPAWLDSRLAAWMSVHEVVELRPGEGATCVDVLTGLQREIRDVQFSLTAQPRSMFLGFVVEHEGACFMGSSHPLMLLPQEGHEAVKEIRRVLRLRGKAMATPATLLRPEAMLALATIWTLAADAFHRRPAPKMLNTDGDPLLMTQDHFVAPADRVADVLGRIASMEGAQESDVNDGTTRFTVLRPGNAQNPNWENTIIGAIVLERSGRISIETNSIRRADALRERFESACSDLVKHRAREHSDIHSMLERAQAKGGAATSRAREVPPEMQAQVLRDYKEKHYATWPDIPLPGLGGLTPREAAKATPKIRRELDLMLKSLENMEGSQPAEQRYDVRRLRAELGMPG